jgi:hypothetical protein
MLHHAQDMKGLSQATVEAAFIQFAAHNSKMETQEYVNFAKVILRPKLESVDLTARILQNDPSVKAFVPLINAVLE